MKIIHDLQNYIGVSIFVCFFRILNCEPMYPSMKTNYISLNTTSHELRFGILIVCDLELCDSLSALVDVNGIVCISCKIRGKIACLHFVSLFSEKKNLQNDSPKSVYK